MSSANGADGACRADPPHSIAFGLPEDPATGSQQWDYGSIDLSHLRERSRYYAEKGGASAHLIGKPNLHACLHAKRYLWHAADFMLKMHLTDGAV